MKKSRGFAMFLVALFVFNAIPFLKINTELQAASENFRMSFDQNLRTNQDFSTPAMNVTPGNVPAGVFNLTFKPEADGKYTISYLLNSSTRVDFYLEHNSFLGEIEARFRLFKWNGSVWNQDATFTPKMYSGAVKDFVLMAPYMLDTSRTCDVTTAAGPDSYKFTFKEDCGVGFKFGSHEIYFLYDNTGNLHYTGNGLEEGFIYNFYLLDNAAVPAILTGSARGYTGIDTNTIDFIPIVSDLDDIITDPSKYTIKSLKNNAYTLNYTAVPSTDAKYPAGAAPAGSTRNANVGMAIRFDEPMVYDYAMPAIGSPVNAAHYARTIASPSTLNMELDLVFEMYHNLGSPQGQIRVTLDNMLALPQPTAPKDPTAEFSVTDPITTKPLAKVEIRDSLDATLINGSSYAEFLNGTGSATTPRRGQITLNNLLPGMIFDSIEINSKMYNKRTSSTSPRIDMGVSKKTMVRNFFAKAFTFLDYRLLYDGIKFTLQFIPYRNYPGTYKIETNNSVTHENNSNGTGFVSVDLTSLLPQDYRVIFAPESMSTGTTSGVEIYSEKSRYDPTLASVDLGPGQKLRVENYQLKPKEVYVPPDHFGMTGLLDLEISWQIGLRNAIDSMYVKVAPAHLALKYSLQKSLTGEKDDTAKFAFVYFDIEKEASGAYKYDYYIFNTNLPETTFTGTTFDPVTYIASNPGHLLNTGTGYLANEDAMFRANIKLENIPAELGPNVITNEEKTLFYYEKIYFLCTETYPESEVEKKSNFDSISLSTIVQGSVPPVRNLRKIDYLEADKGLEEFKAGWNVSAEQLYDYFFKTPYKAEDANFNFNMFISQDEALMNRIAKLNKDDLLKYIGGEAVAGFAAPVTDKYVDYSSLPPGTPGDLDDPDHSGDAAFTYDASAHIDNLRDDEVLVITDMRASRRLMVQSLTSKTDTSWVLEIKGLDKNQTYYMYVNFDISHMMDPNDPTLDPLTGKPMGLIDRQISLLSVLLGATTKTEPSPPDGTDKRPAAPVVEIRDVNLDSAIVHWKHADKAIAGEQIYYEVIRTRTNPVNAKFIDTYTEDIAELYAAIKADMPNTEMVVLKTPATATGNLELLYGPGSAALYEFAMTDVGIQIKDKSLTSNEIYYYYVRTVRVTSAGKKIVSIFNYNTCTTTPVSAPINLVIKGKGEAEFDPFKEFVINFDAPLTNINALGVDYNIELSLKTDEAEFAAPVVLDAATLKTSAIASALEGYFNFTYKVTGLEPGTMYTVRVRIVNIKTKDTSLWSNTAVTRTDMDQEAYNNQHKTDGWKDRYREILNVLVKDTYWVIQDTKGGFSAVYRPTMFGSVISQAKNSQIALPMGTVETDKLTYFIPASALIAANDASKGFVASYKNIEVIISPNSVNTQTNDTVIEMVNRIEKKQVSDYYLKVTIDYKAYSQNVLNNPPLSDNIVISYELVGVSEKITDYDNRVLAEYLKLIEEEISGTAVGDRLLAMVKDEKQAEEFITYINNLSKAFRSKLVHYSSTEHRKGLAGSIAIKALDAPMLLSLKDADVTTNATGYKWDAQWLAQDTFAIGSGKGFYASTPGSYIFAGVKINMPGAENMPGALTAYTIISKYGLTDFLGYDGNINLDGVVTRDTVLGCVARMMGAPKGSNAVQFLKGKGYSVSGAGTQGAATLQESIYLTMTVYETKTKTKAATMQVKNFNALNGITGINDSYKQYIGVANDLGIYNATNMIPRSTITVRQLLDMLTALDKRANL